MINSITVGNGRNRKIISMERAPEQRKSIAGAIKGFLFPTTDAHNAAMAKGRVNSAAFRARMQAAYS